MKKVKKSVPKTAFGRSMPIGLDKESKKKRKKIYLKESIVFAIVMGVMDAIMIIFIDDYEIVDLFKYNYLNYIFSVVFNLIIGFIISYVLDYAFGEISVKRYNKKGIN